MALTQVSSGGIKDGSITNADLDSSAAIDGGKVSPDFGSQNIVTTGTASAGALIPSGSSVPTNGVYLPAANSVAISTNGTGRLFVDSSGNVLLGRSTLPSAGWPVAVHAGLTAASSDNSVQTQLWGYDGVAGIGTYTNTDFQFRINNSERMRLDTSGRLGLGTSTPSANLESQGNVSSTTLFSGFQGLRIQNANGSAFGVSADINFVAGTSSDNRGAAIGAIYDSATSGNHLYFATNGSSVSSNDTLTERLRITAAGNVGIGTASPAEELHVVGDIIATGDITAFYSSDIRLKKDIEPISEPIKKLMEISGVTYKWNEEYLKDKDVDGYFVRETEVGVIAQDVEKVLPEVVATRENGYKAVRYEKLVALLIEAVKDQQKQIDELKARLEEV